MTRSALVARDFGKYLAVGRHAFRQRLSERALLIGRNAFMVMALVIFSRLWQVLLAGRNGADGARASDYLWYVAVAEWVTLSQPALFLDIERDVRNGDVAYHLTRPFSYLALKLTTGFAEMLLGMVLMAVTALVTGYALTGGWPSDPRALLLAVPLGLLAGVLLLLWSMTIGLSAFWLQDCAPMYWIWQKLLFVLGGLFVPLSLYPDWLRKCALWSPFSAMVNGPARLVFGADFAEVTMVASKLLFWILVSALFVMVIYRRALRVIDVHGG